MVDLLPVGSVILLKGATKKLVIMGIMQAKAEDASKVYDYMGVPFPEGYIGKDSVFLFDHDKINDVIFTGYDNPERKLFLELADAVLQQVDITVRKGAVAEEGHPESHENLEQLME